MNLAQIRGRIKNQIDYTPVPSTALSRYLDSVINDAYMDIWMTRPFTFNSKEEQIRVWNDITQDDITWNANTGCAFTVGTDRITFTASPIQSASVPDDEIRDRYIGSFIKPGQKAPGSPDGGEEYYQIVAMISSTEWKLDRNFEGTTGTYYSWKIIHRYSYLPQDLVEILDVSFPNFPINGSRRGQINSIPQRLATRYDFNEDITGGKPNFYVPYAKHSIPETEMTINLASVGAGSSLANDTYVFAMSVVDGDHAESGFCDVRQIQTTGADSITVSLSSFVTTGPAARLRYKIYVGRKTPATESYKWFHLDTIRELSGVTQTTSISFTPTILSALGRGEYWEKQWHNVNSSKYIRFQPRPQTVDYENTPVPGSWDKNEVTYFRLRYLYKPYDLVSDYDTPKIPEEFHHLIVDRALIDVHMKYGNSSAAQVHQAKFDDRMRGLQARYASERDATVQRGRSMTVGDRYLRGRLNINYLG